MRYRKERKVFGQNLKKLRIKRNYTQEAVARDLGVSHSTVSSWERGDRPMTLDSIFKLAEYYSVDSHQLFTPVTKACKK